MYKLHLILKYLARRRIAWVSLAAVMLCTAMVLVVISVMGGWLSTFKAKFRGMSGDLVVYRSSLSGFAGYEEMLTELRKRPEIEDAVPLIRTFGLLNLVNQRIEGVQVTGMVIYRFSKFNDFQKSLWLQYQKPIEKGEKPPETPSFNLHPNIDYRMWRPSDAAVLKRPGMIAGGPLINLRKGEDGQVIEPEGTFTLWASLEVIPIGPGYRSSAEATPSRNIYWIVDGSRTQLFQVDENSVYVPFDVLQKDLQMTPRIYTDADTGKEVIEPARCSEIQIKVKPGTDREALIAAITPMIRAINGRAESELAIAPLVVETWEAQRQQFLAAVEKEKLLMTILFGVISLVAVFLIFCILYMIVVEKTRDIGIIKSVGATSGGVAAIFVGYGFAIGVVGGGAGLVAGYIFLRYINEIHDAIARATGFTMWDPRTYAFDRIPSELDPLTAAIVVTVAILSAVVGAVLPAVRAARLNPVEALRFE